MDDRIAVQTNQTEFSTEILLGRKRKCDQNAGLLRVDSATIDGGDQKESGNEEVICQYDYGYTSSPHELCKLIGFYQGYL